MYRPAAEISPHTRLVGRLDRFMRPGGIGWICGLAALFVYVLTLAPGVCWQDSSIHQYRIVGGQLESPLGLALSHPLHYWLGRLFLWLPVGDAAHRLNLLSAVCGATGVGLLAGLVMALTRNIPAALLAAAALAGAHMYWQMSVMTETYTLAAALLIAEWCALLAYVRTRAAPWLVAVFALNGLHIADHLLGLLTLATYGLFVLERVARRKLAAGWLLAAIGTWSATASPYWTLVWQHWARTGDLTATLSSAFFGVGPFGGGYAKQVLNVTLSWRGVGLAVLYLAYQFPSLAVPIAVAGALRPIKGRLRLFRRVLLLQTAIIVVFVGRYTIGDQITYYVPVCALVALWFGLGVERLYAVWRHTPRRSWLTPALVGNALLPVIVYAVFPALAESRGWLSAQMRPIPFRNTYRYVLRPWKGGDDSASRFARAALEECGPGGWLLGNTTCGYAVALEARLNGAPPGVQIFSFRTCLVPPDEPALTDDELRQPLREHANVVLAPFETLAEFWGEHFRVVKDEPFWRLHE